MEKNKCSNSEKEDSKFEFEFTGKVFVGSATVKSVNGDIAKVIKSAYAWYPQHRIQTPTVLHPKILTCPTMRLPQHLTPITII